MTNIDEFIEWLNKGSLTREDVAKLPLLLLSVSAHEIAHQNITNAPAPNLKLVEKEDDNMNKVEAARLLGVNPQWFRGRKLSFKTRLSHRTVTFSRKGLLKWREAQAIKR